MGREEAGEVRKEGCDTWEDVLGAVWHTHRWVPIKACSVIEVVTGALLQPVLAHWPLGKGPSITAMDTSKFITVLQQRWKIHRDGLFVTNISSGSYR